MTKNARECLEKAFQAEAKDYPSLAKNTDIRALMSGILMELCNPSQRPCESWDDVDLMVKEATWALASPRLEPVQKHVEAFFAGVVRTARAYNNVFVPPPPYT